VATSDSWADRNTGERWEKTEWHQVAVYNDHVAGVIEQRCQKGTMVCIEGSFQTRKWTDQSGQERHTVEIVIDRFDEDLKVLARGRGNDDDRLPDDRPSDNPPRAGQTRSHSATGVLGRDPDDEVPFAP